MAKIGRYEMLEEIGRGPIGAVWKAFDPTIDRPVAIKIISFHPASLGAVDSPEEIFARETRAAGLLTHPGIVAIHDAFKDPDTETGYIVMDLVQGQTLEQVLASSKQLAEEEALAIASRVADALEYAHGHQIIHRNLKPSNLLVTTDGEVKITDFAIAKILDGNAAVATVAGACDPSCMSPEQITGGEVDARSDLFSLGVMLYRMLTGVEPFPGNTASLLYKVVYEEPALPSQINRVLTPGYDFLVSKCLAKRVEDRFASAREFLDAVERVRNFSTAPTRIAVPAKKFEPPQSVQEITTAETKSNFTPAFGKLAWLTAGLGLGVLAGLFLVAWAKNMVTSGDRYPAAPRTSARIAAGGAGRHRAKRARHSRTARILPAGAAASSRLKGGLPASPESGPPSKYGRVRNATASRTAVGRLTVAGNSLPLYCQFDSPQAALTVSTDEKVILQANLKGRGRGRFRRQNSKRSNSVTIPITIPRGSQALSVRVVSTEGARDLMRTVPVDFETGPVGSLEVVMNGDELSVEWSPKPRALSSSGSAVTGVVLKTLSPAVLSTASGRH